MDLERYHSAFEEHVISIEEEADARLQAFRQRCVRNFINRLTKQQDEWDKTFRELLKKSQEDSPELRNVTFAAKPSIRIIDNQEPTILVKPLAENNPTKPDEANDVGVQANLASPEVENVKSKTDVGPVKSSTDRDKSCDDPFPWDARDLFTNSLAISEFVRIQSQQEKNRQLLHELSNLPAFKPFKNELNLFIRTQINSISNSDTHHIDTKTRLLTNLFLGVTVSFQDRQISAMKHPQGQLFSMDLAAQTFVTVGTRLVNSVPAIAKSMASVINGIVKNSLPTFKDLVVGHLQERCPFLVPMYPERSEFGTQANSQVQYMIACGYSQDTKTQALETEDKYLARMRSMTLVYACILIQQDNKGLAWSWLASFLSMKPKPVITATILQAFLQETSRTLSNVFRRQYKKLLVFMKTDFVKMIEEVTDSNGRQSLIKLTNQLQEDYKNT